ncbi:LPXTG cell wall anchor domain-containing protein [Streptococcus pseudopneumoniae]|uniref:LPXTG cell wall anchor domain-containing protein n=1 Tax=Streptococcus pseudopneumoniae TaxID=257758 RepID=UPI0018B066E5|nr:LPXTG cell wall anchor domain-containing protein [Streptococcus pseudopneumoniae]MBF9684477.1 LPXTG cell wall anchor domain-containing protein [Streptococcus pseudopneumoniae]
MNKLTKLGIVTFSAVTLSAAVPTLVRAEENVAPQPNVAAKPNVAQPTPAPKPNGSWVDFSMLDPIAKPKPKLGKEFSKPAEKPVEEPAPVEKPSTEGNILANGTDEAIAEDKKNAEIEKKYNVDPTNQLPEPGLPIITPEPEQPITDSEEMKKMVAEDLAYKKGAAKTQEEYNKLISEANKELWAVDGVDIDELLHKPIPGAPPGAVPALSDVSIRTYEIQADFLDADRVKEHGYTTESRIDSPKRAEVWSRWNRHNKDSADGILTAKKFSDYTFSHVVKAAADHPDIDPDPKVVRVSYDAAYALRGSGYKNGKGDNLFRYYFIYTKNKPVEEKPKDPQPAETEKPAEISKPAETVEPTVQPKPAENKPVENKPAETPVPATKPAETPQTEVKPAEQPQPAKPVKPAENAGLQKVPYRNNQPKRWFNNGTGRPTLTTNDLAAPLPAENVEKTSYGWWTAEPDLLHAGSHIKVNTFNSNFNNPMFENGKEIKFKGSGFGDMDSRFKPALVRVKVPELEGMNYEAYTIFYEVPNKNGNPTYGTNRTLQGGGISLTIKSKEKKEDIQVYTLTKDRKLEELYYPGFPSEETNRYDEKTKTHSYNLFGETYDTYVFLFKNPAEKPAEQVKPEVKPSEQPKPDKQPSVPTVPADQPQPAKPEKPTEQPVNPVAPITPTTPVTPTLNPAIPNNTRVLSNKAGSVQVHGSEATLKNVSYIKVEETKPTSLESKDYKAFDIHLYDANGKAIQPNGMVLVSLSADKPVENVYYVAPDGTLQALKFKQDTDKVTFETNHFSIYAMSFKVAASRNNGGSTTPVPVVNSSNTEQKGNDASSTKTQAESLATKTETISKQVAKTLPNTGENHSILATLFGMLTLTAGLFSFRKESE